MVSIYPMRVYYIIRRGLCLLYMTGSPEPHNSNKLKFPRLNFCMAFFRELRSHNSFIMEQFLNYTTPNVEVIEAVVEKGFAGSPQLEDPDKGKDY